MANSFVAHSMRESESATAKEKQSLRVGPQSALRMPASNCRITLERKSRYRLTPLAKTSVRRNAKQQRARAQIK